MWDVGCEISNCELRIAKLGTRPKGGSPQDNLKEWAECN
jgi:hypothetical protein